jgi:hypothetical protein
MKTKLYKNGRHFTVTGSVQEAAFLGAGWTRAAEQTPPANTGTEAPEAAAGKKDAKAGKSSGNKD